jgi:hypothetical protein
VTKRWWLCNILSLALLIAEIIGYFLIWCSYRVRLSALSLFVGVRTCAKSISPSLRIASHSFPSKNVLLPHPLTIAANNWHTLNPTATANQRAATRLQFEMPPSALTAREIFDLPIPQQLDHIATLSMQQYEELTICGAQRRDKSSPESSVRDPAHSNRTSEERRMEKEIEYVIEEAEAEYDELFHYNDPQETDVDRGFQVIAAELKAHSGGPQPLEICREESQSLVQQIADLHKILERVVVRHEVLIRSRWRKKTRAQKTEVLLAAEPDTPKTHRPDIASFMSGSNAESVADTLVAHPCPHINLEDLLLPNTL